ncbi:MAG: hypothetical protein CSA35_02200 [Dethiosulfovibrio peptidovorans]|nr:MAG: hypothetical protein CSA35_02200 [Dethiosulfovibrio peptidovorans]
MLKKKDMKAVFLFLSIALLCLGGVYPVWGEVVMVEGEAAIIDGNIPSAREMAKKQLYRNAIEQAIGARVEGITEMKDFQVVRDKVFSKARGLVQDLEIIKESESEGILRLSGRCRVEQEALDGVLGPAVIDALGNPRVVVVVDEMIGKKRPFLSSAEGMVEAAFHKAGFLMMDKGQLDALAAKKMEAARLSGDEAALTDLAREVNADVILYGKGLSSAFARQKVSGQTIYGVRTLMSLKAVIAQTGQSLGIEVPEIKTKGMSEQDGAVKGLKKAASHASVSLVNEVAYALTGGGSGVPGRSVRVTVDGLDFGSMRALEQGLQGAQGVVGVYRRSFRNGRLELDVSTEGSAEDVAVFLDGQGFEVLDLSAATVGARLKP